MNENTLSVREIQEGDIELITQYWLNADATFLRGMGVDIDKVPSQEHWRKMLRKQLSQSYPEKESYCIIWEVDGKPVGHSNVNKIIFGQEAYMHLHLWNSGIRKKGIGTNLAKMTIPYFFKNMQLKTLYCEPHELNPAPRKTLERIGFKFLKEYVTTPGWICFEQSVNLWELSLEQFNKIKT